MNILVMHRIQDRLVRYADGIDHDAHDVTYIGVPERMKFVPHGVPARIVHRPGSGDTAEEVLAAIAGLPRPDMVIAMSEYDLIPAAEVREKLDIPGDRPADVLPVRDKTVMKAMVDAAGIRVPRFLGLTEALARDPEDIPWSGATVVKPKAGASSEGVHTFESPAAALADVRANGLDGGLPADFQVEEFVTGSVLHIDGLIIDGAPVVVQASRYLGTCLDYASGVPLGSVQIDTDADLVDWSMRCLTSLGLSSTLFHLEAIESPDGLVFLEVGARFGGGEVVDMTQWAIDFHMPSEYLRFMTDGVRPQPRHFTAEPERRYGWFIIPGHTLGTDHCRVTGTERFENHALMVSWKQRRPGEPLSRVQSFAAHEVPLSGIFGPARSGQLEDLVNDILATVRVEPIESAEFDGAAARLDQ